MNIEQITTDFLTRAKAIRRDCISATVTYSTRFGWEATVHWAGACEISDIEVNDGPEKAVESCLESLKESELRECA